MTLNNSIVAAFRPPYHRPHLRLFGAGVLVFIGLLLLYSPAVSGGLLWDDSDNITKPDLRSWPGLTRIWFQWGSTQTYYPLLHTVYWFEYQMWGESTLCYHLASILFHAVSVCLVYLIVRRLRIPGAVLAAAIFSVHPIYVETLAWITEQKNTLSGMFFLGSLLTYLHFDEDRCRGTYVRALALFVLALLTKPITVTLPVALLIILWWKKGSLSWQRDVLPLVLWFALSLLAGMFTSWYERTYAGAGGTEFAMTLPEKVLVASRAIWFYLSKLFWPANLTFMYPRWVINSAKPAQYLYVACLTLLFLAAWLFRRRQRAPLAALLFFVGILFPLLGFFPAFIFRYTYVCDHFQYLASLGIVVFVSAAIASTLHQFSSPARYLGLGFCALLLSILAWLTWNQAKMYSDAVTLYRKTIELNPTCWMAYNNLGFELANRENLKDALENYQTSLKLNPNNAECHNNLGSAYVILGRLDQAIEEYHHALQIQPNNAGFYDNLGIALTKLGRTEEAIDQFLKAIQYKPDFVEAHYNLGKNLEEIGWNQSAIEHYQKAIQLRPDFPEAYNNLGNALLNIGEEKGAIECYEESLRRKPDYPEAQHNLGLALFRTGHPQKAIERFQEAIRLNPAFADAYFDMAIAYAQMNRMPDAHSAAQTALNLARSQGQTVLIQKIETWLAAYRAEPGTS